MKIRPSEPILKLKIKKLDIVRAEALLATSSFFVNPMDDLKRCYKLRLL